MKEVLMIHEVYDDLFSRIDLEKYTLTFDDGLATQWKYFDKLKKVNTEKYFFFSTGIVCQEDSEQDFSFIKCGDAHKYFFETKNAKDYMKISQLKEIKQTENCFVGCHGHAHIKFRNINNRVERMKLINTDTLVTLESYKKIFNEQPTLFCFPYNWSDDFYIQVLIKYGFKKLFGKERIDANLLSIK